jgi:hypothetical protein
MAAGSSQSAPGRPAAARIAPPGPSQCPAAPRKAPPPAALRGGGIPPPAAPRRLPAPKVNLPAPGRGSCR